jgi:hypothetical protein
MGIDSKYGYTKVTSPLRRFMDMVAHWNIKAELMDPEKTKYPFKSEDIVSLLSSMRSLESYGKKLMGQSTHYWLLEWIRRREFNVNENSMCMSTDAHTPALPIFDASQDSNINSKRNYTGMILQVDPVRQFMIVALVDLGCYTTVCFVGKQDINTYTTGQMIQVRVQKCDPDAQLLHTSVI